MSQNNAAQRGQIPTIKSADCCVSPCGHSNECWTAPASKRRGDCLTKLGPRLATAGLKRMELGQQHPLTKSPHGSNKVVRVIAAKVIGASAKSSPCISRSAFIASACPVPARCAIAATAPTWTCTRSAARSTGKNAVEPPRFGARTRPRVRGIWRPQLAARNEQRWGSGGSRPSAVSCPGRA
jgi:hypothetical protein